MVISATTPAGGSKRNKLHAEDPEYVLRHKTDERGWQTAQFCASLKPTFLGEQGKLPNILCIYFVYVFRKRICNYHQAKEHSPRSLRALYGEDIVNNAVHASESLESANRFETNCRHVTLNIDSDKGGWFFSFLSYVLRDLIEQLQRGL